VINGATNKVIANISVGSEPEGVAFDSANGYIYVANSHSGTVSIISTSPQVIKKYTITFTESGLPSGYWYVNITGQQSSGPIPYSQTTYSLSLSNGSYSYAISTGNKEYKPSYIGSLTVNGSPVSQLITFSELAYTITLTESGLPSGTSWSVTLNGSTLSSTTNTIIFTEPNGTYSFSIGYITGYSVSPSSGTVTVNGASVNEAITFTPVSVKTYSVTFAESGLPSGTSWSVTFNGKTETSNNNTISFTEPNGTYSFTISPINGYSVSPSSGSITVKGTNISQNITFTSVTTTTPPSSNDYLIYIIIAVVVIAAAIGAVVAMGRRKK